MPRLVSVVFGVLLGLASVSAASGQTAHHMEHTTGSVPVEFQTDLKAPGFLAPGRKLAFEIQVRDAQGGQVTDFLVFQEKVMHLILVRDDLGFFSHLHPEHLGQGRFRLETVIPAPGEYTLFADYQPAGAGEQVSLMHLQLPGTAPTPAVPAASSTPRALGDTRVSLLTAQTRLQASTEVQLAFSLQEARDGAPASGLKPYLGEKGHLVIIRKSARLAREDYIHAHALRGGPASEIVFATRFPEPGWYRLWCQFARDGSVQTADFWVEVFP